MARLVPVDAPNMHDDRAHRCIIATALAKAAPLVTRDRAIRTSKVVDTVW